ncbi:MAG TPA: hypothetical protein VLB50_07625 [Ignavibacteriaceae bacterium]|nr:hypothetical protein [Ignavibacteriaceae bacterium]
MNTLKVLILISGISLPIFFYGCSKNVVAPLSDQQSDQLTKSSVVESDMGVLNNEGIPMRDCDGIFTLGWNELFGPIRWNDEINGHAMALVFGDSLHPRPFIKNGIDVGSIYINYNGGQIQLEKRTGPDGGVFYSLYPRFFDDGHLDFIPGADYEFEITGSDNFSPLTYTLTAPMALVHITTPVEDSTINPANDLTLQWSGGTSDDPIAIRLMPIQPPIHPRREPHDGGGMHPPMQLPPLGDPVFILLDSNPGEYTIAASTIQNLINQTGATKLVCVVSQVDKNDVQHDSKDLKIVMHNGDSVLLNVQQ